MVNATVTLTTDQWAIVNAALDVVSETVSDPRYRWLSDDIAAQILARLGA